jgi:hypothetical protein
VWSSLALGIDPTALPAPTTGRQLRIPPARQLGFIVEGTPQEAAQTLVAMLRTRRVI